MEWTSYFCAKLDESFDVVYLEGSGGVLYGAGSLIDAVDLLRLAIGSEEMEHYQELLVDGWAVFHLLDQTFGLDPLMTFDFLDPSDQTTAVRYDLLDIEGDRVFVSVKHGEGPLLFIAAADVSSAADLLSSLMLTLLGTNTAFGDQSQASSLPAGITNSRPDLVSQVTMRKAIELLVRRRAEDGVSSEAEMMLQVRRFGNPVLRSALDGEQADGAFPTGRDLVDLYFESAYTETD